jgi:hypothetical protein
VAAARNEAEAHSYPKIFRLFAACGCRCGFIPAMTPQGKSLIPKSLGWLRVLRLGLLFSSVGWGISFGFTSSSWDTASHQLYLMGADRISYQPLLDYWLKMASAAFGGIGILSALACLRPSSFEGLICFLGPFHGFIGAVLAVSALQNGLRMDRHPTFVADISFCLITASLISAPLIVTFFRRTNMTREPGSASR